VRANPNTDYLEKQELEPDITRRKHDGTPTREEALPVAGERRQCLGHPAAERRWLNHLALDEPERSYSGSRGKVDV
jgi:hypothetical protein